MPTYDTRKLKVLARKNTLTATDKKMVLEASREVDSLNKKIALLEAQQKDSNALVRNTVVKQLIEKQTTPLKQQIAELQKEKTQETRLKANPKVKSLIKKEIDKKTKQHTLEKTKLTHDLKLKDNRINELIDKLKVTGTKPIDQKDFNNFLSNSIRDLQNSFEDTKGNSNTDIIIRDVDIEATVITEMRNKKPVLIIPSREDMKELGSQNLQKVKYSLSVIPKDIDE